MAPKPLPSQELLVQLLRYEPDTGKLFWLPRPVSMFTTVAAFKTWNTRFSGGPAFSVTGKRYLQGRLFGEIYFAHRIIWKMVVGLDAESVDHINGNTFDNRLINLRDVSLSVNQKNSRRRLDNTSGVSGITWRNGPASWEVSFRDGGRRVYVGIFKSLDDAKIALSNATQKYGFTERHGT